MFPFGFSRKYQKNYSFPPMFSVGIERQHWNKWVKMTLNHHSYMKVMWMLTQGYHFLIFSKKVIINCNIQSFTAETLKNNSSSTRWGDKISPSGSPKILLALLLQENLSPCFCHPIFQYYIKFFKALRMALQKLDPRFLGLEVMQSLETNNLVQMRFRKLTAPIFSFSISVIIFSFSYKHKHLIL